MNEDKAIPQIFLAHSSKDKPLALRIAGSLRDAGLKVWLDEWKVFVGDSISRRIQHGLEESDFIGVLITHESIASGWVEKEWQARIGQEARDGEVKVLPLLAADCQLPLLLRDKKFADFRKDYATGIDDLIAAIESHCSGTFRAQPAVKRFQVLVYALEDVFHWDGTLYKFHLHRDDEPAFEVLTETLTELAWSLMRHPDGRIRYQWRGANEYLEEDGTTDSEPRWEGEIKFGFLPEFGAPMPWAGGTFCVRNTAAASRTRTTCFTLVASFRPLSYLADAPHWTVLVGTAKGYSPWVEVITGDGPKLP